MTRIRHARRLYKPGAGRQDTKHTFECCSPENAGCDGRRRRMGSKLSGPAGQGGKTIEQNADINVTPFVDIMLVLLIIFMVAAPLATVSIKLDLPPATPPAPTDKPKEPVYITIQESGSIF
ncbi:MAG: biopolymer transporter ExbD, partial [Burkholderiaceae bacterium]